MSHNSIIQFVQVLCFQRGHAALWGHACPESRDGPATACGGCATLGLPSPVFAVVKRTPRRAPHRRRSRHLPGGRPAGRIGRTATDGKYLTIGEDPHEAPFYRISRDASTLTALVVRPRPDSPGAATADMAATIRKVVRDLAEYSCRAGCAVEAGSFGSAWPYADHA
jgi:hypothetical protein